MGRRLSFFLSPPYTHTFTPTHFFHIFEMKKNFFLLGIFSSRPFPPSPPPCYTPHCLFFFYFFFQWLFGAVLYMYWQIFSLIIMASLICAWVFRYWPSYLRASFWHFTAKSSSNPIPLPEKKNNRLT